MQVFPIYISILNSFLFFQFALLLVPFSCIIYLEQLMRLTPTTNQGSLIWSWIISGLISVVGYGYVQQLICKLILLISGFFLLWG